MRVLIVVPAQDRATGNWVTASRLQQGLTGRGHTVTVTGTDGDSDQLLKSVATVQPDLVLLLHAWRSGRPWLDTGSPLPFALLLTGTDVNIGLHDKVQAPVIATVLERSAAILSQNQLTVATLSSDHPELAGKVHHLPAGISLGSETFPLRQKLGATPQECVLLCPAGIRPVKGVVELIELVEPLILAGAPLRLAFCGPILDAAYGERLFKAITGRPWATYLAIIPPAAMPEAMRQADIIVSNSFSEGVPNALVEAASLGRPVVARDIPGNRAVIHDDRNGLLYSDAAGFHAAVQRLLDEPGLRTILSRPEPERFSAEHEAAMLENIFHDILSRRAATSTLRL